MTAAVDIKAGSVYLSASVCETYFKGIEAVAVLIGGGMLRILPVRRAVSGGCLLKIRNAAGDRVAAAPDVFQANGLADWRENGVPARWSPENCALLVPLPPSKSAN